MTSNAILTFVKDGVRLIKFNRPSRRNAWLSETYTGVIDILRQDAISDLVVLTIITGEGEYYSSGNDFAPQLNDTDNYEDIVVNSVKLVSDFVKALIDYPKLLIAVVNGPAIGFAVTTLALFDVVYASDRATFVTPFIDLGISPEGCSSYLFPRIMGRSVASEMLILGRKITAHEALKYGLVSEIVPHEQLGKLLEKLQKYGKLSVNSVKNAKELITFPVKEILYKTNNRECDRLIEGFMSEEFMEAFLKFTNRPRNKL